MTAIDLPADKLSDSSKAEITLRSHELDKVQTAQRTTRNGAYFFKYFRNISPC